MESRLARESMVKVKISVKSGEYIYVKKMMGSRLMEKTSNASSSISFIKFCNCCVEYFDYKFTQKFLTVKNLCLMAKIANSDYR